MGAQLDEKKFYLVHFEKRLWTEKVEQWNDVWCRYDDTAYIDREEVDEIRTLLSAKTDEEAIKEAEEILSKKKRSGEGGEYIYVVERPIVDYIHITL